MGREIERKFLVQGTLFLDGRKGERIVQGYLVKAPGEMSTRVRVRAGSGFLTLKAPRREGSLSRDEFEYPIPLADAQHILAHYCAGRIIEKTRYLVEFAGFVFEVDVFEGRHSGLILAEVELPHEQTPLPLPPWVGDEVSHDKRFGNFSLAQLSLDDPPASWPALPLPAWRQHEAAA